MTLIRENVFRMVLGSCGMWRGRDTVLRACGASESRTSRRWGWWLVVAALAWLPVGVTLGQTGQDAGGSAGIPGAGSPGIPGAGFPGGLEVPGVDESHGRTAHRLVEEWVKRGGVPGERAAAVRVSNALGVRVTLRLDGVTLGQGTRVRSDLASALTADGAGLPWAALPTIDLIDLIEPATAEAIADAVDQVKRQRLESRIRAAGDPGTQNLRAAVAAQEIGPQLDVDVQIAYAPEQIVVPRDAAADMIYARFASGYHGLFALPSGATRGFVAGDTLVWPGTALARNSSPRRQVVRLLTRCGLEPDEEERLGRPDGVTIGRFAVLHMVRPLRELPVMRLVRGGQLLPARFVDEATLGDMADRIALHLYNRFIGVNGQVRGTYFPARALYKPELASDLEASLASYALVRYVDRKQRDGNNDRFFQAMVEAAQRTVDAVAGRRLDPDGSPDAVTAAFCLLTALEAPAGTFDPALAERVAGELEAMLGADGQMLAVADDPASALPAASRAAALAALGWWYARTLDAGLGEKLVLALDELWTQQRGRFDVNTLPWIAMVHVQVSGLLEDAGLLDAPTRQRRSADLTAMNELIAELQVVERPAAGPTDVEGGIILSQAPEGSPPNPNWQTAPLFSFMATTLRDDQIVSGRDRPGTLVTASAAARFLGQLMIDQPNCFGIRSPQEAVGGIRLTLWDNTLDIAPSAITLVALLEMRETLEALSGQEEDE